MRIPTNAATFSMKATRSIAGMMIGSGFVRAVKVGGLSGDLSHAVYPEKEAGCIVDEAVENGVSDGGVGDDLVLVIDGHLAGDDSGTMLMPIVNDLKEIAALVGGQRGQSSIVENEELDPR